MKPGTRRRGPIEEPISCTQTNVTESGERIFALCGGGISTGGMLESELRGVVAFLDETDGSKQWRKTKAIIDTALAAPPRDFSTTVS